MNYIFKPEPQAESWTDMLVHKLKWFVSYCEPFKDLNPHCFHGKQKAGAFKQLSSRGTTVQLFGLNGSCHSALWRLSFLFPAKSNDWHGSDPFEPNSCFFTNHHKLHKNSWKFMAVHQFTNIASETTNQPKFVINFSSSASYCPSLVPGAEAVSIKLYKEQL